MRDDRPDPVLKTMADQAGIDYLHHPNVNSDEFIERMKSYEVDLFVSMSFNQIFRKNLLAIPPMRTINCHAGKLPFYRGRNILNWALINDEKEFGITVHYIDEGIDTGDIIKQTLHAITDADDYGTLLEKAHGACADILVETIALLRKSERPEVIKQEDIHPLGSYCIVRKEGDEKLDWNQSSRDVFNFIRAICDPGPQARTFLNERELLINRAEYIEDAVVYKGIPGSVLRFEGNSFLVKTLDSYVRVLEWSGVERLRIGDRLK
ncbi:MAG: methionyl-tRNA formyltransferase [bacterium]|nr:methionyl-tRNA formyltransferase [bacterium]